MHNMSFINKVKIVIFPFKCFHCNLKNLCGISEITLQSMLLYKKNAFHLCVVWHQGQFKAHNTSVCTSGHLWSNRVKVFILACNVNVSCREAL